MNLTAIGVASLPVRDLQASRGFYTDVLNLKVIAQPTAEECVLAVGEAHRFVLQRSKQPRASANDGSEDGVRRQTAFIVGKNPAALEAARRRLDQHRIPYRRVHHEEYESLYLTDPDGHLVELFYWPSW